MRVTLALKSFPLGAIGCIIKLKLKIESSPTPSLGKLGVAHRCEKSRLEWRQSWSLRAIPSMHF